MSSKSREKMSCFRTSVWLNVAGGRPSIILRTTLLLVYRMISGWYPYLYWLHLLVTPVVSAIRPGATKPHHHRRGRDHPCDVRPERWGDQSRSKKPTLLGSWTHGNILAGLISCLPILMLSKSLLPLFTPPIFQDSSPYCRFITFQLGQFHFSSWGSSIKYSILPVKSPFSWRPKLIFVAKHPEFCAPLTASTSSVTCFSCTALASEKHGETREIGRLVGFQYLSIFKKLLTPQWHRLWLWPIMAFPFSESLWKSFYLLRPQKQRIRYLKIMTWAKHSQTKDLRCLDAQAARGPSSVLADKPLPNTAMRARLQKAWNVWFTQWNLHSLPTKKDRIKPFEDVWPKFGQQ